MGEDRGTPGVAVKCFTCYLIYCKHSLQCVDPWRTNSGENLNKSNLFRFAKASVQNISDGEGRKLGEQRGLDTPVVPAVNYADFGVALGMT